MIVKSPAKLTTKGLDLYETAWLPFLGAMGLVGLCLYAKYLFGNSLYIFPLEGSDTYYQYWPLDRLFGEMIQNWEIHNWTYRIGLGKQVSPMISYLNPFRLIVQLMPPGVDASAYIIKVILEIGCAALLMRAYLLKLGIDGLSSLIFPLLYGFNGYLLLWGQHVSFGVIFTLIPLTLYSLEVFIKNDKIWPLIFSLSLFMSISIYFFTMACIFFVIFMTCKIAISANSIRALLSRELRIIACYLIAGGLAAWIILPEILYYLESPRIGIPLEVKVFDTYGWMHYISLLRIFSNNIFGAGVHYYGPLNYYEAPQIYCGLLTLLLVPQFFCFAKTKEKIIYGIVLGVLSLALFSPYIGHIFNATFTLNNRYTFVLIFLWIYLAAHAFYYIDKSSSINKPVFYISWSILFLIIGSLFIGTILLQFEWIKLPDKIATDSLRLAKLRLPGTTNESFNDFIYSDFIPTIVRNSAIVLGLLSAYGIVFVIYIKRIKKSRWLLAILVIVELIILNYPTINERITLKTQYLNGNLGYYDGSMNAIDYLESIDHGFYRVDKNYDSVFLNDAAFQGYFGTKGYTSLTEPSSASFFRKMKVPHYKNLKSSNYMGGFETRPLLNSLVSVKYVLTKNLNTRPDLEFIKKVKGINIYQNRSALPMAYVYHETINTQWFKKLKPEQKDTALFLGVLLNEPWIVKKKEKTNYLGELQKLAKINQVKFNQTNILETIYKLQQAAVQIDRFGPENIEGRFNTRKPGVLFFSIPYNKGWQAFEDEKKVTIMPVNNGFIGIPVQKGAHRIRLAFEPYGKKLGTFLSIGILIILGIVKYFKSIGNQPKKIKLYNN